MQNNNFKCVVCALYKFTALDSFTTLRAPIKTKLLEFDILGTILLAREGINGAVTGTRENMDEFLGWLGQQPGLSNIEFKESLADHPPFKRAKVKLKKEIVTMGVEDIDPRRSVGTYIEPQDWNELISDPDVLVVDTRNDYEIKVGRFANSVNPRTNSFREFPSFAKAHLNSEQHRKIAMYCTGGIRCEKSTAFLKQQGFDENTLNW